MAAVVVALVAVKACSVVEAFRKVCAPLQEFAVVVPNPRESMFEFKRMGKVAEMGAW